MSRICTCDDCDTCNAEREDMARWVNGRLAAADRLEKENADLRELLTALQWSGETGSCPDCGAYSDGVHQDYCALAAAIKGRQ